ncbi:MAG: MarR family transcriptional regulator [Dehalococcoidia bacterium]
MTVQDCDQKERILSLAEDLFKAARNQVPRDWHRLDLTMPQLKVLLSLFVDGPLPCSSLAEFFAVSLPTMNGVLGRLKKRGLISRYPDRRDRRRILNSLTPRGHQLIEGLWTSGQDWLSELLDRMDSADLETVERALTIIVGALRRQEHYAWTG